MQSKSIILFIPNSRWLGRRPLVMAPYSASILASLLKDGYDFSIFDANGADIDESKCIDFLEKRHPDVVMVSAGGVEYHLEYRKTLEIAKRACPSTITILGGVYPTTMPEEALSDLNVDYIFMGHAEERINQFLDSLFNLEKEELESLPGIGYREKDGSAHIRYPKSFIHQVKKMVRPDYSKIDLTPYLYNKTLDYQFNFDVPYAPIISSYGCYYNCLFCASRTISGRGVAFRPIEDVLEEIEYLMDRYKIQGVLFLDDCILSNRKRIDEILTAFIQRNYNLTWKAATVSAWDIDDDILNLMQASGCSQITISVESGSQRVLKEIIRKPLNLGIIPDIVAKCKKLGINIGANFVIGFPGETWDEIRQTCKFAEECDFDIAHFHIATPLPNTDLYKIAHEQGLLPDNFSFLDPSFFGFGKGFISTDEFTPFELEVIRAFEWDRINFSNREKTEKIARELYKCRIDTLSEHRKATRKKLGIHFSKNIS